MTLHNFKKTMAIICIAVFSIVNYNALRASATVLNSSEQHGKGGLWVESEEDITDSINLRSISVPRSYDITTNPSTAKFFPAIGDQGQINSCAGWASTYYQYTYEVNRFRNETTTANNTFSPSWTYNYINHGGNYATFLDDAYFVLEKQGAMLLADYPHPTLLSNYSFSWPTNLSKMRAALRYRATNAYQSVSHTSLSALNAIKSYISNGKPAVIWTNPDGWNTATSSIGQQVIVRSSYSLDGHFMTVVGYDDDFAVTVNGQTLLGAFKLANSWGSSWQNDGYIWVSYDALLSQSSYGTSWQTGMTGQRTPVFGGASHNKANDTYIFSNNRFAFITIHECDNYFVETIQFTSYDPWQLNVYGKNGSVTSTSDVYKKKESIRQSTPLATADTRYLVFDYTDAGASFDVLSNLSTAWVTYFDTTSSYHTYNIRAQLTDNLGNQIELYNGETGSLNNHEYAKVHYSNIAKGRVTAYDNNSITEADADLVIEFIARNVTFSSLQQCLADYNEDGEVDISDAIMMYSAVSNEKGRTFSLFEVLPGKNYSMKDFIEQEMGITYSDYINENILELNSLNISY